MSLSFIIYAAIAIGVSYERGIIHTAPHLINNAVHLKYTAYVCKELRPIYSLFNQQNKV